MEALIFKEKTLKPLMTKISVASEANVKNMLTQKHANSEYGQEIAAFREKINVTHLEIKMKDFSGLGFNYVANAEHGVVCEVS